MKKILGISLAVFFFLFLPQDTFAHFPATDGNITVTLHVDPDDDPPPGQKARVNFYFVLNNTTKPFDVNKCNCVITISEKGKQLFKSQLNKKNDQPSSYGAYVPFIFPEKDVYLITIKGSPLRHNTFKPFYLTWNFRIDGNSQGSVIQGPSDILVLVASWTIGIIILIGIGVFIKKEVISAESIDSGKKH